jgi:ABC-type tungstate transport system substrate-binding protein
MKQVRGPLSGENSMVMAAGTTGVTYALIAGFTKKGTRKRLIVSAATTALGFAVVKTQPHGRAIAAVGVGMMVGGGIMTVQTLIANPELRENG